MRKIIASLVLVILLASCVCAFAAEPVADSGKKPTVISPMDYSDYPLLPVIGRKG